MRNYHIEIIRNGFSDYIKITFQPGIDRDVIATHINLIDGVKKVNFNSKNCKEYANVYVFTDVNIIELVEQINNTLTTLE